MLAASIMSAPASLVIAKLIYPETEKTNSLDELDLILKNTTNAMDVWEWSYPRVKTSSKYWGYVNRFYFYLKYD